MSDTDNDQKTEKPTAKKLSEAADKGQFAKSPELSVLFTLAAAIAVLGFTANATAVSVAEYSVGMFSTFGRSPVEAGRSYTLKLGTLEAPVTVESILRAIDTSDLSSHDARRIERNGAGEVVLRTKRLLALDEHASNPLTGRFVLVEDHLPVGGGIVSMEGYPDQRNLVTVRCEISFVSLFSTCMTVVRGTISWSSRPAFCAAAVRC